MYLFELWFSPDICSELASLDHIVTLFLLFEVTSALLSIAAAAVYIPANGVGGRTSFYMVVGRAALLIIQLPHLHSLLG